MLEAHLSSLPIQITGPRQAVEQILADGIVNGAQRHDCRSIVWIEAPDIEPKVATQVVGEGCRLHYIQSKSNTK